jgi:hypothetical protein
MLAYLIGDLGSGTTAFLIAAMASVSIPVCIRMGLKRPQDYDMERLKLADEMKLQMAKLDRNLITSHRREE